MPFIVGAECANTIPIPISMYIRRLITSNTVPDIQFTLGVHYKCRWLDLSILTSISYYIVFTGDKKIISNFDLNITLYIT